jgi:iron complex outermembrane receptor protein
VIARTRPIAAAALLALVATSLGAVARADERTEARRHFRAGLQMVAQRRYLDAIREFEEANRILPNVHVLYNIARAYADAGDVEHAIQYYQQYLTADVPDRAEVERVVQDLERRRRASTLATTQPTTGQPTTGQAPGTEPATAPVQVGTLSADQVTALRSAAQTILQFTQGTLPANAPPVTPPTGPTPPSGETPGGPTPPPTGAAAPERPGDDESTYDERLVTASLSPQSPLDSPNASTVITAQDIRVTGLTSVPELLRRAMGVDVMGLDSSDYQVGIRGFNRRLANRVLVLVDGRSVYLDFIGLSLWTSFPVSVEEIERIEIIRGPGSALYGADAYSGVVNIITRPPGEGRNTLSVGAGNGGQARAVFTTTGRAGGISYRAGVGYEQAQTFGRLIDGTDQTWRLGVSDPNLALQTLRADIELRARLSRNVLLQGGLLASRNDFWFSAIGPLRRFYTDLDFVQPFVQLTVGGFVARVFSNHVRADSGEILQRVGGISLDNRLYQNVVDAEVRYGRTFRAGSIPIGLTVGANYRMKHISWSFLDADHVLHHVAAYAQAQATFASWLSSTVSFRVDRHPVLDLPVFSPRLAVILKPSERRALRLSAGTSFRTPTMLELYLNVANPTPTPGVIVRGQGSEVNCTSGNHCLEAESAISVDVGFLDQTWETVQYEVHGFFTRGTDLIELGNVTFAGLPGTNNPNGPLDVGAFRFFNDPSATSMFGAEAGVRVAPLDGLDLYANYTFAYTQQQAGSLRVGDQRTPQHKFNVGVQYRSRFGLDASLDGHFVSGTVWREQDFDPARGVVYETFPLDSYFLLNGRVGYRLLNDRVELGIVGTNLTDNRRRQHPFGAPMGARVMGVATIRF